MTTLAARTNFNFISSRNRSAVTNNPFRACGFDGRSAEGRRRRDLIEGFVAALGGSDNIAPARMDTIVRAAELKALAESLRRRHLAGGVIDLAELIRMENLAARAEKQLGIKPGATAKPPTLREYLASRQAKAQTANSSSDGVPPSSTAEGRP